MGLQPGRNGWRTCVHLTAADWLRRVKARLTYFLEETGDEGVGGGGRKGRAPAKRNCRFLQSSDEQRDSGGFGRCVTVPAAGFKSGLES